MKIRAMLFFKKQKNLLSTIALTYLLSSTNAYSICAPKIFPPFSTTQQDQVTDLPHYGCVTDLELSGILPITHQKNETRKSNLFYWFVGNEQNSSVAPIVLWLNGGPGASSFYGFFTENGPYGISANGTLFRNYFSWTKYVNYLIIDNPIGVGYSYAAKGTTIQHESEVAPDLYQALQAFYQRYPVLRNNPLYLSGESYAGKYLPELATVILQQNKNNPQALPINLRGIILGDGWVNPLIQQGSVGDYAYENGLIDDKQYAQTTHLYNACATAIKNSAADFSAANKICGKIGDFIYDQIHIDRHDIRTLHQIDYDPVEHYLNNPEVKKTLHVDPQVQHFSLFNDAVSQALQPDIQKSDQPLYEQLLNAHLPILIYSGLEDGSDSNFLGTTRWINTMHWSAQTQFHNASTCVWRNEKDIAGFVRSGGALTQVKIRKAGHMAAMDQPENVADMLNRFINQQSFCSF